MPEAACHARPHQPLPSLLGPFLNVCSYFLLPCHLSSGKFLPPYPCWGAGAQQILRQTAYAKPRRSSQPLSKLLKMIKIPIIGKKSSAAEESGHEVVDSNRPPTCPRPLCCCLPERGHRQVTYQILCCASFNITTEGKGKPQLVTGTLFGHSNTRAGADASSWRVHLLITNSTAVRYV